MSSGRLSEYEREVGFALDFGAMRAFLVDGGGTLELEAGRLVRTVFEVNLG